MKHVCMKLIGKHKSIRRPDGGGFNSIGYFKGDAFIGIIILDSMC